MNQMAELPGVKFQKVLLDTGPREEFDTCDLEPDVTTQVSAESSESSKSSASPS